MKQKLRNFYVMLLALIASFTALQASATAQVEATLKEATTNTITITFTPNNEVKEYYVCMFDHDGLEATFEEFKVMFGLQSIPDMIKQWGKQTTSVATNLWKSLAPDTEYDFCVASYDANGMVAPVQTFTFKTLVKGGEGASVINIEIKEFTQEQGVYKQRIVCKSNDQTSRFYSQPFPEVWTDDEGVEHHYSADDAKAYLMGLYEDPVARDTYALYDVDDWQWELDYAAKYHATAMGLNAKGEWGEMTDLVFTTPGYVDPSATSLWWGYGDGETLGTSYGASSEAARTAAIRIPESVLSAYDGASLTDLRFAVAGNGSCSDVSYFIVKGKSDNDDANFDLLKTYADHAVAVGTLKSGWHEFHLDTPITINKGDIVYVGYTATGLRPISISKDKGVAGSCLMMSGKKFYDYGTMEGYEYALNCQIKLEASNLKASVELDEIGDLIVETGQSYEIKGSISTLTPVPVTSYIAQLKVDGVTAKQSSFKCDLQKTGATADFTLKSTKGLSAGEHNYTVSIISLNGEVLENAISVGGVITAKDIYLSHRVVLEDLTGTWCGYCPRAALGVEKMKEAHPDNVIAIAVHKDDAFEIGDYESLKASGYPCVYLNRGPKCGGGEYASIEPYYQEAMKEEPKGDVNFVVAQYTDASRSKVALIVRNRFAKDYDAHTFSLAFVVTEDDVYANQSTYLEYGGGWIPLQDVARSYKSYAGLAGSVPTELKAGEKYYYRYDLTFPNNVNNRGKSHIIALLQQNGGRTIINADVISEIAEPGTYDLTGFDTVIAPTTAPSDVFDLSGRRTIAPQRGQMTIQNGRKMIQK